MMDVHNIVLIGESGSGKTELSANVALRMAQSSKKEVFLIDMDQTKCLFRARDFSSQLEDGHVHMAENPELWDSPLMPLGVSALLQDDSIICVFDVGGNAVGATMLGQFAGILSKKPTKYYYVINPCRAFSGTVEEIEESLEAILISARIPKAQLEIVVNPYMGKYTTPDLILEYYERLETELEKTGRKAAYLAVAKEYSAQVSRNVKIPVLELETFVDKLYV